MPYLKLNAAGANIPAKYLNRHALITGQTGTGKTVSVLKLVESVARLGSPVFMADVKGDMASLANGNSVFSLDVLSGGAQVPLWSIGVDLLARAMELSETQTATLEIVFTRANAGGMALDSLADLRRCLADTLANRIAVSATLGQLSAASIGVIQRALLRLENMGASPLFGSNAFDLQTLFEPGQIVILDATRLYQSPRVYGIFLLWLMRELWQRMPEVGDLARPSIALVFDEAHTIFSEISPALLRQTEQTARLIRSKGVALIWASQNPNDIPPIIRDQCATRLEHDRALGVGYARFQTLDLSGKPTPVKTIRPALPDSALGPAPAPLPNTTAPMGGAASGNDKLIAYSAVAFIGLLIVLFFTAMAFNAFPAIRWQWVIGALIALFIVTPKGPT